MDKHLLASVKVSQLQNEMENRLEMETTNFPPSLGHYAVYCSVATVGGHSKAGA